MANIVNVNGGAGSGATQVIVDTNGNINVTVSRSVIGTVANVPSANYANFANVANIANTSNLATSLNATISNVHISGGANGYVLQTDGAGNLSWSASGGGGGTPGGSNTQVQFNDDGAFGGDANLTFDKVTGIFTADKYSGNGAGLNNIVGANVTGTVANATYATTAGSANTAATVTTNAQPNITSVGTLTSVNSSGNITAPNVVANTGAFYGNAAGLTNIPGANVNGQVANALVAGTVYTNAQPNITSVGTLTSLAVTGNVSAGNVTTTGTLTANVINANYVNANVNFANVNSIYFDTANGAALTTYGQMSWNDGEGVPDVLLKGGAVELNIGAQQIARVYNADTVTLTKGMVVYVFGAQGNRISVKRALATTDATSAGTLGFVVESITAGSEGYVQTSGPLFKIDTSGTTAGALVFLSPTTPGGWTTTRPTAPDHTVVLGYIERVDNNVGSIYVKVDNGYELDELHNVVITSPAAGQALVYNSSNLWVNGNAAYSNTAGTVTTNAQPNITSVGTLTSLAVTGNATVGNLIGPLANGTSNVTIPTANGNVEINVGDPSLPTLWLSANGGPEINIKSNANISMGNAGSTIFTIDTSNKNPGYYGISVFNSDLLAGNIEAQGIFTGNASGMWSIPAGNISGIVADANYAFTANYALYAEHVLWPDQPNITSVGRLSNLIATNITIGTAGNGNLDFDGLGNINGTYITTADLGNLVVANYFQGDGSGLSNLTGANVTGTVANATYAIDAGTAATANSVDGANVTGQVANALVAGTVYTAAQPNITSVGTLTSLDSSGNITGPNVIANTGAFYGNAAGLTDIPAGNINGQVANALVAGTVYTAAQPNITSVGTLTGLDITGNLTSGNANLGNLAYANFFQGDGGLLTNISATGGSQITNGNSNVVVIANGNVTTSVAGNANVLVVTGTGANIAGTLQVSGVSNLGPASNVVITGGTSGQYLQTDGAGNLSWETVSGGGGASISNGTSNVNIATSGGNVTTSVAGNVDIFTVTGTGVNISGTFNSTGIVTAQSNIVVDGSITRAASDANVTIAPTGTGVVDVSNKNISNLAAPTANSDASTKLYVDNAVALKVDSNTAPVSGSNAIINMIRVTQAQYNGIGTPDSGTLYVIVG